MNRTVNPEPLPETNPQSLRLALDALGQLTLQADPGRPPEAVTPVRAFPLAAPDEGISLVGTDGHERAWIDRLSDLPAATRRLIDDALSDREFMPEIERLSAVSTFSTPSTWQVHTNRGPTTLVLKGEEDIRRLPDGGLLITDAHGISFRLREPKALDRQSKRLLERFL